MDVSVNGEKISIPTGSTVAALLDQLSLGDRRIAVELNNEIVPRSDYSTLALNADDRLEIVQAIGGG